MTHDFTLTQDHLVSFCQTRVRHTVTGRGPVLLLYRLLHRQVLAVCGQEEKGAIYLTELFSLFTAGGLNPVTAQI